MPNVRRIGWVRSVYACILGAVVLSGPANAQLHDDPPVGCGKAEFLRDQFAAQEAAEQWRREYRSQVAGGLREALEDTDLLHVDLEIEVLPGDDPNLIGTNTMTIESRVDGLSVFTFRLRSQFTITSALVNGSTPVSVSSLSTTTRQVTLDQAYDTGDIFTLTIAYEGVAVSAGFGSIEFTTHGPLGTPVIASLSEPYYAYSWWPVKDGDFGVPGDNSDKFTADLAVISDDSLSSALNGVLVGVDPLPGNRHRYRWSTLYPIATYLVSFSTTNYNQWTQTYTPEAGGSMPVVFYIYPESDTPGNRTSWEKCVAMLSTFRDFYGEYPFVDEKYGIYQFPFGGGMEHQTFTGQGGFGESLTAHELGHQWWGDNVTCETWSDIWLNEGFATFSECLWEEYKTGPQNQSAYFSCMQARKPTAFTSSVYVPPAETNSVSRIFSSTYSYRKGAWVLHMLRRLVGDSTFFNTLGAHRIAHEGGAATTDEFAAVASATYGQNLTWFFQQWVYSIGAPAYSFGWQTTSVAGQNYLLARIQQTHTDSTANWPATFIAPVDLVATIGGSPQTLSVWNDNRSDWYVVPVSGPVTALQFDPNQWILRTSANNVTYQPGPPTIVATNPAPGADVDVNVNLDEITVTFHTNVNASAANFTLVGANTGAKALQIASGSNVNPVVIQVNDPLPSDNYTLTVAIGVTGANSGQFLDGEVANPTSPASFPSGNGTAGGTAMIQFAVSGTLLAGPATASAAGPRYLAVDVGDGTQPISLRVAADCTGSTTKYVGVPTGPNNIAPLVDNPLNAAFLTPAEWGDPVRVTGTSITPMQPYRVQVDLGAPGNPQLTLPVITQTWRWGDANNDGLVELTDILCLLSGYGGQFVECSLFGTDLGGQNPNQLVDLTDVLDGLSAYAGGLYDGPDPCP